MVGAGHNGLVAACYLARAGRQVVVLEQLDRPGGGSRTEETVPGYHFDVHSAAHNLINMTAIPAELDLAGVGLVYQEMDPFSVAVHADGRRVRFHRSVEATVASIAEEDPAEAAAYQRFMGKAIPVIRAVLPAIRGDVSPKVLPGGSSMSCARCATNRSRPSERHRPLRPSATALARVGPDPRAGRRLRRPRRSGPDDTGRCALRLLAGCLPPVRPVARQRRRPVTHRRPGEAPGGARGRAALLGTRRAHRDRERPGAGGGAPRRRAHRCPFGGHRHRSQGGVAGAARSNPRRRGRGRPGGCPPVQRGPSRRPRRHRCAAALCQQRRR